MRKERLLFALVFVLFLIGFVSALSINLDSPVDSSDYNQQVKEFSWTNSSDMIDCWYSLNEGVSNITIGCNDLLKTDSIFSNEGWNTWTIYANDSLGNEVLSSSTFWVDSIAPVINIINLNYPLQFTNQTSFTIIAQLFEKNWKNANNPITFWTWDLDGTLGMISPAIDKNTNLSSQIYNSIYEGEGIYNYNLTSEDTIGHISSTPGQILIDTLSPFVTITSPTNGSKWRSSVSINSNASDDLSQTTDVSDIDSITNEIYNASDDLFNSTSCSAKICSYQWDSSLFDDGLYYILATAVDKATNPSTPLQVFFDIDNTNPNVFLNFPLSNLTTNESISINISASDAHLSNLILMNASTSLNTTIASSTFLESIILLENEGEYSLWAWANDTFGNTNQTSPVVELIIDKTAPEVNAGENNITNSTIAKTATATDSLSGLNYTFWSETATGNISFSDASNLTTEINATQDGLYTIQLIAVDKAGNSNTDVFNLTWDTTPPTTSNNYDLAWKNSAFDITLNASDLTSGVDYIMWNYNNSATWNKSVGDNVVVNVALEGNLTLEYYAVDKAGNAEGINYSIYILIDKTAPDVNAGSDAHNNSIFFQNATTSDVLSGIVSWLWSKISGLGNITFGNNAIEDTNISADADDDYVISLNATDNAGNSNVSIMSLRWDTTAPNLTLIENETLYLEVYADYIEYNATAVDTFDGDRTSNIVITGSVNTSLLGTYTINYSVSDSLGNTNTTTRLVLVNDTIIPNITLTGANPQIIEVGTTYNELNATATDNYNTSLVLVIDDSAVNTSIVGTYLVTYDTNDGNGNDAVQVTRIVNVIDTISPVVTLDSPTDGIHFVEGTTIVEINYTATDTSNNITSCNLTLNNVFNYTNLGTSFIITNLTSGKYTYSVSCTDGSSNSNFSLTQTFTILANPSEVSEFTEYTNLSAEPDISSVPNFFVNNSLGNVLFNEAVDFSEGVDWTQYINISQDRIETKSDANLDLNKNTTLTFYNINLTTPEVLKDGVVFTAYNNWNYNSTSLILSFEVSQAGVYTIREYVVPAPPGSPGGGSGGGSSSTIYYECSGWGSCASSEQTRTCEQVSYCTISEPNCFKVAKRPEQSKSCIMPPVEELSTENNEEEVSEEIPEEGFVASITGGAIGGVTDFVKSTGGIIFTIFLVLSLVAFAFKEKIKDRYVKYKIQKYKFNRKK